MTRRLLTVVPGSLVLLAAGMTAAHASEPSPPAQCFVPDAAGDLPDCAFVNGDWSVSYPASFPDGNMGGFGGFGGVGVMFGGLFVLILLIGVGMTVWRISTARQLATQAGLDANQATAVALLDDEGLAATYVASSLRPKPATPTGPASSESAPVRSAADRLAELQRLKDQGLVTAEEYQAQRKAIVDSV
jgi:hypothetical protein